MQVKISEAKAVIINCIKAKLVPMMVGSPAIGKSSVINQIAKEFNLKVIDLRLAQCDPTDLLGFPSITGERAGYVPMDTFPIEGDEYPINTDGKPYAGWLLFLDELTSATTAVQAASYKLVLDRMVGKYNLHKNVAIVCAGNLETDNAIVESMSTALQSRLVHLELVLDVKEWLNWATEAKINHKITSYINFKPGALFTFMPDHTDQTYASPRTWEFADRFINVAGEDSPTLLAGLSGALSEGVAREFLLFCKIYKDLPTIAQIIESPSTARMSEEPSVRYAITGSIAHHATEENLTKLMEYIARMPVEFQVVCLKETVRRNRNLMKSPAIQKWIAVSAADLF